MRDVPQYIAAVDEQKKIVFCSSDTSDFAAYNVGKRTWTFWKDAKFSSHWSTLCLHGPKNPTVVGETMYWYASKMRLYAYDLRRQQWFLSKRGIWDGYEKECGKPVDSEPYTLLHLGGKLFCILWTHIPSIKNKHGRWSVPVCCTKLLIRKDLHTSTLKVSMFSTQVCRIPTRLGVVEAFLLKDLIQQTKSGRLGDGKEVAHKKTGKFDSRLS
ncbi:hypothetical protein RJ640_029215 [Escallonia rubra]|uniref:Uncharacterized protein n=1 Tax=Escallonia rubra TaxID=112253 RepID=A0AA88RC32_9ASTE|nr:hypothetical protein RJ640_029215 [Escallonia rubra]